nr:hypothetical protein [Tanacetum cinerariifolium]
AERYEYMIRYSAYFDNDKQHRKQIADQEVLYDKMSVQLVELDTHVIGLGYTLMFLTHSDEALENEKFKTSKENKIEFAYDYGNLNASYVNKKINFEDDYFQDIINSDFEKIDSPFQQTSFESSENVSSESENQIENDCLVLEKEYDQEENLKVIAPGMFKLNVSQCVSPISMSKLSCDSNNVESKIKRKRHLDTFSSVRRPKNSGVIWKKKGRLMLLMMNDLLDDNNFFIFDDESVKISLVSKMPFRKKPSHSMNVRSKSNLNKYLPRTVHKWLPKMKPLVNP